MEMTEFMLVLNRDNIVVNTNKSFLNFIGREQISGLRKVLW